MKAIFFIPVFAAFLIVSCKKEENTTYVPDPNTSGSTHVANLEGTIRDSATFLPLTQYRIEASTPGNPSITYNQPEGDGTYGVQVAWFPGSSAPNQYPPTSVQFKFYDSTAYVGSVTFPISVIEDTTLHLNFLF